MISRSTILALVFAGFATLSLAGVSRVQRLNAIESAAHAAMPVYQLPRVVITGKSVKPANDEQTGN